MREIIVHFEDGNTVATNINGNDQTIIDHYIGKYFNFGDREWGDPDRMVKAVKVEFLDKKEPINA